MKALSGIERMEENSFKSYYLNLKFEKCLSIDERKGGNNIINAWQHVIFISTGVKKVGLR